MKIKKHPKANLENYSKLFTQLGLVLSLFVVYALLQSKTFEKNIVAYNTNNRILIDDTPNIIEFMVDKSKPKKKVILDVIKTIKNDTPQEEDIIQIIKIDDPVKEPTFVDVEPIEGNNIIEDVPFEIIEDVPVFPGCKGDREQLKTCLQKKITKHINRKFNADLAQELGLTPGVKRIFVMFKIDKKGDITDIKARAPHKRLQDEAIRIVKMLPKMEPGMQRKIPVGVKYSLPIAFKVE